MALSQLLLSAALSLFGLALVAYLSALLLRPLFRSVNGKKYSNRLRRAGEKITVSDDLFAAKKYVEAIRALRKAPFFELFEQPELVDVVREHHQNILSRCVLIAEELHTHAENLPDVERLILERSELQSLFVRASETFSSLRNRRERAGKDIPLWSKTDFEKRIADIRKELEANREALSWAFDKLFDSIETSRREGDIVYH